MIRTGNCLTALLTVVALVSCTNSSDDVAPMTVAQKPPGALIVCYAPDSCDTFPAPKPESLVAMEWLEMYANSRGLDISTRKFSFGDLVIHIGPRRSGDSGNWFYEINGQMATDAVSVQRVARTDTLVFTFK